MKTFLTKSKSSFSIFLLAVALPVWSKPVAQVTSFKGQVFVVTPDGKTKSVVVNQHLDEKSELMVGEDSTVVLNDYYDATYSLLAGTHLKFFDKSVLLKKGKTWIQSQNPKHVLSLTTANGHVDFTKGEFISTFDQVTSRSQFLVVNGEVEVSNVLEKNAKYSVPAGTFTLVDPEIESGVPRAPTKVGVNSMNEAIAEFKSLPNAPKEIEPPTPSPSRKMASVEEKPKTEESSKKKGEIIFLTSTREPASVVGEGSALQYWKTKTKKVAPTPTEIVVGSDAPIKIYGMALTESPKSEEIPRQPASLRIVPPQNNENKVRPELNIDSEFTTSLRQESAEQPKYSKELDNLIHDLKSY